LAFGPFGRDSLFCLKLTSLHTPAHHPFILLSAEAYYQNLLIALYVKKFRTHLKLGRNTADHDAQIELGRGQ